MTGPKGAEIGQLLWDRFRESRYAPYFAQAAAFGIARGGAEGRFAAIDALYETAMALDRDGIVTENVVFGRAKRKALAASQQPDLAAASRLTSEARADLEAVVASAKHQLIRLKAQQEIRKIKTPEELKEQFRVRPKW